MWRNDIKCKYMFMFPLKNLARKGLKRIHRCRRSKLFGIVSLNRHRDELDFITTVYPKKYAHVFVVLCFVVVMQSFIMYSHEVFIHIHQGCFAGTGAIVRLPQCQWSKPDGYGKNQSMYNHNKAQQSKNLVHISWDILYIWWLWVKWCDFYWFTRHVMVKNIYKLT